jgi:hypothetical protein
MRWVRFEGGGKKISALSANVRHVDVIEIEICGIGTLRNSVIRES